MNEELLNELLAKPVGPEQPKRELQPSDLTKELELTGNTLTAVLTDEPGVINEGTALAFLEQEGQNPSDWEVTGFRKSQWDSGDAVRESVRFTFKRAEKATAAPLPLDELMEALEDYHVPAERPTGSHGFLVLIGDMQFGKIDGDGAAGTLERTIMCIAKAAALLEMYSTIYDIGHVHIAWLGDHIEGFVSQGGANVWRTNLTLNEQIRLTRRVMLYALKTFAPMAEKVTMAAVPGNHGESVRFEGTGLTRYDDSHDTEALIAVADAAELKPEDFGHVTFFVPQTDELIVVTEVAGTIVAHHHGHKFGSKKDAVWDWWEGQAFNRESPMHMADLLVAGHLHHEHTESNGSRLFIQAPALEQESTWFRHNQGVGGSPGLMVAITKDGRTPIKHTVTFTDNDKQIGVGK